MVESRKEGERCREEYLRGREGVSECEERGKERKMNLG